MAGLSLTLQRQWRKYVVSTLLRAWLDNLSPAQRKRSMQRNTSSGTSPEKKMRTLLRASRLRFRSQYKQLPGTPDFVLPEKRIAIFVHGCFWHSHHCQRTRPPSTNKAYWTQKLTRNVSRQRKVTRLLKKSGWCPLTIWECQLKVLTARDLLHKITRIEAA